MTAYDGLDDKRGWRRFGFWRPVAVVLAAVLLLYYPIGMAWVHVVDDDPAFAPADVPQGASQTVAAAAALIDREVNGHGWTPNDPFFKPAAALDNMPNYQQGIIGALSRFAVEMGDQIGRTRGSSAIDPDLDKAAGLLKYPGDVWIWNPSVSLAPTATSERQYLAAMRALNDYNRRLAAREAVFERRADNLQATIDRISKDLGSMSAVLDQRVAEGRHKLFDGGADDVFYQTKGRLYAYLLLLRGLGQDFSNVIVERELGSTWDQMLRSFASAVALDPWVVMNGAPDAQMVPSHLAAQGFFLLRARTQLTEIGDILLK